MDKVRRILFLILVIYSAQLAAYKFTEDFDKGIYWANFPIKMEVIGRTQAEAAQLFSIVKSCEEEWENAVGMDIWDFGTTYTVSSSGGSNAIYWSNNFAQDTGRNPTTTLAVTIRYSQGTHVTRSPIILNASNTTMLQNWGGMLRKVVLHELGHTFGLDHTDVMAIMYPSVTYLSNLQSDDEDGAQKVLDEAQYRQRTGYVSPYATTTEQVAACGSVGNAVATNQGTAGFLTSFFVGFFGLLVRKIKKIVNFRK